MVLEAAEIAEVNLYLQRAENEFRLAKSLFNLSSRESIKIKLGANPNDTFYSSVISHCYYSIFYSAKAILLAKNIKTKAPEVHKKTFYAFKKEFVDSGLLNNDLISIYESLLIKSSELLGIFKKEKWKRGHFTYHAIAQANIPPARESLIIQKNSSP